jgi:DNA transposition AAA+ family ATPase
MERPVNIPANIVETETVAIAREAATLALALRFPVHIVGRPGTGKSSALWHVAREMGGSYCEVSAPSKGTKAMFELLLDSIGERTGKKYVSEIADEVYYRFQPHHAPSSDGEWHQFPRLLVVDEVQTLEPTAFRELLRVQEKCGVGLVLAGNAERLAGQKKDADTWAQIESRIAVRRTLPGPNKRDCELIGSTYNVEGKDAYEALSAFGTRTNFRDLTQLLEIAKSLAGNAIGIRKSHLETALRLANPKTEALKLLRSEVA